ncbi:unnamed protein product [Heterobilharzia americana]|nr:unnamed protein product [Heterobilharzia americana]
MKVLTSSVNQSQCDKYKRQWNMILERNRQLQEKLLSRENYLKLCQDWLDLLLQLNDQLHKFESKMLQLKYLTEMNQTNPVDTCLDQFQIDMNQLVIWIESVKDLLNTIKDAENRHFDDNTAPISHLQINISNSLNYIMLYHSNLERNLFETSQWNAAVKNVYRLLNEMNEEQLWIKGLDDNQLWLRNIEMNVATHQIPQSVEEAKIELDLHKELGEQILARKEEFADLISYGRCITAGETDTHYVQLDQRLDRLENGWSELMQMWTYQQKLLKQDVQIQTFFRDAHSFENMLSTQQNRLMSYQLLI